MSKGLEAFKSIKECCPWTDKGLERLDTIEKELKALKIIKEKRINLFVLLDIPSVKCAKDYNIYVDDTITQEEYDLLKEVVL